MRWLEKGLMKLLVTEILMNKIQIQGKRLL